MDALWSKFIIRLGQQNPFFACLALFAKLVESEQSDIALTQGQQLIVNPEFVAGLKEKEAFSYWLHQLLHLALQHTNRGLGRDVQVWNIAADIVVNNIISDATDWPVAPNTASNSRFTNCSVEDVYFQLLEQHYTVKNAGLESGNGLAGDSDSEVPAQDLKTGKDECSHELVSDDTIKENKSGAGEGNGENPTSGKTEKGDGNAAPASAGSAAADEINVVDLDSSEGNSGFDRDALDSYGCHPDLQTTEGAETETKLNDSKIISEKYWEDALLHAEIATNAKAQGCVPSCMQREFAKIAQSEIDWRKELWRFVSDRRSDFNEFDTRHLYKGLYLEELRVDGLTLAVAVDTSGSISTTELGIFMKEIESIQKLHADVTTLLYYCDAAVDWPHKIEQRNVTPEFKPTGGGGTSFVPFFNSLEQLSLTEKPDCIIYFTDGYGDFPDSAPTQPTFWFITEQGVDLDAVPFGRAVSVPSSRYLT